jgi:hypothetical protein
MTLFFGPNVNTLLARLFQSLKQKIKLNRNGVIWRGIASSVVKWYLSINVNIILCMSDTIITNTCKITMERFKVVQMLSRLNCISPRISNYRCHIYVMKCTLSWANVVLFSDKKKCSHPCLHFHPKH